VSADLVGHHLDVRHGQRVNVPDVGLGVAMKNPLPPDVPMTDHSRQATSDAPFDRAPFAHRLLTASEVAEFVGCHQESVRRAYLCG
jgi:hypothetical protein